MSGLKWKWNLQTPRKYIKHPSCPTEKKSPAKKKPNNCHQARAQQRHQLTWWHGPGTRPRPSGSWKPAGCQTPLKRVPAADNMSEMPLGNNHGIHIKSYTMESCFSYFGTRSHIYFGYGKAFCWKRGPLTFLPLITTFQWVIRQWKSDMAQNPAQNGFVELVFWGKMLFVLIFWLKYTIQWPTFTVAFK